jgi:cysteine desulfurase
MAANCRTYCRFFMYFDHNATTPICPEALQAWTDAETTAYYHPGGLYRQGLRAHARWEQCLEELGQLLGCDPRTLVITSGATEGSNAWWHAFGQSCTAPVLLSPLEHSAISQSAAYWLRGRCLAGQWPAQQGRVSLDALREHLRRSPTPGCVSLLAASNETGVLQPWQEAQALCQQHGAVFFCDLTQWVGKMPLSPITSSCDAWVLSGHKFGAPRGIGLLKLPQPIDAGWLPLIQGNGAHSGRAGTLSYPLLVALKVALEACQQHVNGPLWQQQNQAKNEFESTLVAHGAQVIGQGQPRLFNTSLVWLPHIPDTSSVVRKLDRAGFAVAQGAACRGLHGGDASELFTAMGYPASAQKQTLRISSSYHTPVAHWQALSEQLVSELSHSAHPSSGRPQHGA